MADRVQFQVLFPQSRIVLDWLIMLDWLYGSRLMTSSAVGWLADCAREFNVYLPCQSQVKLTGTPSTPHARRLGSIFGAKQISLALAYVERENPSGGIFASTALCAFLYNFFLVHGIVSIRLILLQAKQTLFVGQILKAKTTVFLGRRDYFWFQTGPASVCPYRGPPVQILCWYRAYGLGWR